MSTEYVGSGNDDGSNLGRSDGKIGFYGTTPIVQGTISSAAGTDAATLITELTEIRAWLVEIGLVSA